MGVHRAHAKFARLVKFRLPVWSMKVLDISVNCPKKNKRPPESPSLYMGAAPLLLHMADETIYLLPLSLLSLALPVPFWLA